MLKTKPFQRFIYKIMLHSFKIKVYVEIGHIFDTQKTKIIEMVKTIFTGTVTPLTHE